MLSVERREDGREAIIGLGFSGRQGMEENELEEGEACSGQEDDSCIDPDVALSYIDEKLQDVLGHFQKDFEGGVSAENLGAKFGGYGSFLPTYQRSPSILTQPRSPPGIIDHGSASRSPYNLPVETTRQKNHNLPSVTASLISRTKIIAVDDSGKNNNCESTLNNWETNSPRNLSNKMANGGDQKMLKVHIKVCPDNILARNNAAIYSGLGLDISPTSSPEDSLTGSGGLSPEYQLTSVESPRTILQNMVCFPVPGGFLLSPLRGNAIDLKEKAMSLLHKTKGSMLHNHASEPCAGYNKLTLPALDMKIDIAKMKTDEKKGRPADLKNSNFTDDIDTIVNGGITQAAQALVSDATNNSLQFGLRKTEGQIEHLTEESTKGSCRMVDHIKRMEHDQAKVWRTTPEFVTDETQLESSIGNVDTQAKSKLNLKASKAEKALEESVKICKNSLPDMNGENKKYEKNYDNFEGVSDGYKGSIDQCLAPSDHVQQVSAYKPISVERERQKAIAVKDQLEDKRKHQGSQMHTEPSTGVLKNNLHVQSSEAVNVKKKSSCLRTNQSEKKLKVKSHKKSSLDMAKKPRGNVADEALENGSSLIDLHHKDKLKVMKPENDKEPITFREASKERPGNRKIDNHRISEASVSEPIPVPLACNAATKEAATVAPAPVVIEEQWVCCDSCQTWRLLPYDTNPEHLPKTWQCSLLNWLPGMNSCNISEEETTKALRALYMVSAAENGINSDGHHEGVASSITTDSALQRPEHNVEPVNRIMKKTNGPRDVMNHLNSVEVLNSLKKNQYASMMNRNSDDGIQNHEETCSLSIAAVRQGYKSKDLAVEKQNSRHLEKHENTGRRSEGEDLLAKSTKHPKLKSKRMHDRHDNRETKRVKKENLHNPVKNQDIVMDVVGKAIPNTSGAFSTKAPGKNSQKYSDVSLGNEKHDSKANFCASSKKINEEDFLLPKEENKRHPCTSIGGKSDMQDFSAKKKKLREWQGSQRKPETQISFQQALADQVVAKEALSESEVLKEIKSTTPKSERKVFKVDGSLDRKARGSNLLPSSGHLKVEMDDDDRIYAGKETLVGQYQENPTSRLAMRCVDSLRGNMCYAQPPTAATSSSSKVSGSQRAQTNFQEARGSPIESVSSSPSRIYDKGNSFVKDETVDVTTYVLGSPKRCSDSEADEGKNHLVNERKGTAGFMESHYLESHGQGRSGTLDLLGGASNYHDKEAGQLFGGKAPDDLDLKKCFNGDPSPAKTGDKKKPSCSINLSDEHGRYARGSSDEQHAQDLDKMNNYRLVDGVKNSSSRSKEKHRSHKFDSDTGMVKISGAMGNDTGSQFLKNGDSYREDNYSNHFRHCSYSGEEDTNIQEKDGQGLMRGRGLVVKNSNIHRRDTHSSSGMQKSADADDHSLHPNQNHIFDPKATVIDAKNDKSNVHDGSKHISPLQDEKSLIHSRWDQNDRAELARGKGKSRFTGDKEETQKQGPQMDSSPLKGSRPESFSNDADISASKVAKQSRRPDVPNGVQQINLRHARVNGLDLSSSMRKDSSIAQAIFKEARDLKHTANRLKNEGLDLESTGLYFEAALKFLHAASLWEPLNFDNSKLGDATQSITIYSTTAKLCEFCAHEYERLKETAPAALAYKCVEVGYLKAAFFKCPGATTDRQELQTAVQMVPPGESPSSSASDVDNLNNQGILSKVATCKGANSPQIAGHHVIAARNHPHLMRLLAYTNDLNCAFEATRKSHIAVASACATLEKYGADAIASIRQVLDCNFHNVRGLLQLVRLSMESISH